VTLRRVPLKRKTPLRAGRVWASTPKLDGPRARRNPALDAFKKAVNERAAGRCEAQVHGVCIGTGRLDAHHIGGRVGPFANDPDVNGLGVCRPCHAWIGANPDEAYRCGLAARRNQVGNPAMTGVAITSSNARSATMTAGEPTACDGEFPLDHRTRGRGSR
jgi:hypothetical protein